MKITPEQVWKFDPKLVEITKPVPQLEKHIQIGKVKYLDGKTGIMRYEVFYVINELDLADGVGVQESVLEDAVKRLQWLVEYE